MHSVFTADDSSDTFWALSSPAEMNRSTSEWAFEQFLDEFTTPAATPRQSVAEQFPVSSAASCSVVSQFLFKRDDVDEEIVEIKKPDRHRHRQLQPPQQLNHPPPAALDPAPTAPINSDQYREFLKNQLDLACAADYSLSVISSIQPASTNLWFPRIRFDLPSFLSVWW
ncbi:hypothetical protein FF2_003307 [Malus domestica]